MIEKSGHGLWPQPGQNAGEDQRHVGGAEIEQRNDSLGRLARHSDSAAKRGGWAPRYISNDDSGPRSFG